MAKPQDTKSVKYGCAERLHYCRYLACPTLLPLINHQLAAKVNDWVQNRLWRCRELNPGATWKHTASMRGTTTNDCDATCAGELRSTHHISLATAEGCFGAAFRNSQADVNHSATKNAFRPNTSTTLGEKSIAGTQIIAFRGTNA